MIQQKIICDRCKKVAFDSEKGNKTSGDASAFIDLMFGNDTEGSLGYVEVNVIRFDGKTTKKLHFCGDCYDIAVKAWNG